MPATFHRSGDRTLIEQKIRFGAMKGMVAWGNVTRQSAMLKAPVDRGRLARNINLGNAYELERLVFYIQVGTNVEYARAQEFGSGLHAEDPRYRHLIPIRARRKKALAFHWPGGPSEMAPFPGAKQSGLFFFKAVMHPGVPPHPYLRPAVKENHATGARLVLAATAAQLRGGA